MQYNILIRVPENISVSELELDAQYEISLLYTEYPPLRCPGSITNNGEKLIHARITTDIVDVETLLNTMFLGYGLNEWVLLGIQTSKLIDSIIMNSGTDDEYVKYIPEIIMELDKLEIFRFIPQLYEDEENTIQIPKSLSQLHVYNNKGFYWVG